MLLSYSPFLPGRTTGIQQTTKVDRDCYDRPVIKVSKGMNCNKIKKNHHNKTSDLISINNVDRWKQWFLLQSRYKWPRTKCTHTCHERY